MIGPCFFLLSQPRFRRRSGRSFLDETLTADLFMGSTTWPQLDWGLIYQQSTWKNLVTICYRFSTLNKCIFLKDFKGYFYWREKKTHTHFKVTLSKHESMAEFARCFVKWAFAFNSPRNSWWFDVVSTHIKSMCSALPLMMISSCFFLGDSWLNMAQPHWPVQRSMWIFFHALPTRLGWGSVWRTARLSRSKPEARWAQAVACDGTAIIMV